MGRWGRNGCCSDAQIFNDCQLKQSLVDGTVGFPDADLLPGDDRDMPYFIVAVDAFALRPWLMKPFSCRNLNNQQHIFNYRLSRARRVVESVFRILANCFRCLLTTMAKEPQTVTSVVFVCVTLHNIIRTHYWGDHQILADDILKATIAGKRQKEYLMHYPNNPVGEVPRQNDMI